MTNAFILIPHNAVTGDTSDVQIVRMRFSPNGVQHVRSQSQDALQQLENQAEHVSRVKQIDRAAMGEVSTWC